MISQREFTTDILPITLAYEGGFSNHKNDKGGMTYRGITRKNYPTWGGWKFIDMQKEPIKQNTLFKNLDEQVADLYYNKIFKSYGLHRLTSPQVATALFDFVVHSGASNVAKAIAPAINKVFGLQLSSSFIDIDKINQLDANKASAIIMDARKAFLQTIIQNNPSQGVFASGWFKRVDTLRSKVTSLVKSPISLGVIALVVAVIVLVFYFKNNGGVQ